MTEGLDSVAAELRHHGQDVEVHVKVAPPARKWGERIVCTAGALSDDPDWDAIMPEVHRARKLDRQPQMEEE